MRRRALLAASKMAVGRGNYFTVIYLKEKKNYAYEEGMTWEEFIGTDYNIEGWDAERLEPVGPLCVCDTYYGPMCNEDGSYVYITDIISNKNYYLG